MIYKDDPWKHGFYEVNGYRTFSKLEAIQLQKRTGHWPEWNFNRAVFDQIDWTKDPDIDLMPLYRARARQIREAYDYCVIFYSGGADSHNILSAWLQEGLKIDEIAAFWNYEATGNKQSYMNAEITNVVLPKVQKLKDQGVEFKFRLIDISDHTVNFIKNFDDDYNYFANNHFSPNNIVKNQFRDKIKEYSDIIAAGKSLVFIWGIEKPHLFNDNDRFYFQFFDMMDNCVNPYTQQRITQGWYDELFYWSPDMPEIVVKQSHVLRKFIQTCNLPEFYQLKASKHGYNKHLKKYISETAVKSIIYPTWDSSTYCNGKSRSMVYSDRDSWLWESNIDTLEVIRSLSRQYFNDLGSYWLNDGSNPASGVKCHSSPRYYLE